MLCHILFFFLKTIVIQKTGKCGRPFSREKKKNGGKAYVFYVFVAKSGGAPRVLGGKIIFLSLYTKSLVKFNRFLNA
jgi:hypothetical protein